MKIGYALIRNSKDPIEDQINQLKTSGCEIIYKEIINISDNELRSFRDLFDELKDEDVLCMKNLNLISISMKAPLGLFDILIHKKCSLELIDDGRLYSTEEIVELNLIWTDLLESRSKCKSRSVNITT